MVYVVSSSILYHYLFFLKRVFFILLEVSYSRRGEEHSFILKPATSVWNNLKVHDENPRFPKLQSGNSASKLSVSSNSLDGSKISSIDDQYAVMVSCRCNYTSKSFSPFIGSVIPMKIKVLTSSSFHRFVLNKASKLFFKQPTSWRPRTSRDIMISVASEMSGESPGPCERNSQLAVQVNICLNFDYLELGSYISAHI